MPRADILGPFCGKRRGFGHRLRHQHAIVGSLIALHPPRMSCTLWGINQEHAVVCPSLISISIVSHRSDRLDLALIWQIHVARADAF